MAITSHMPPGARDPRVADDDPIVALCQFVTQTQFEDLPADVVAYAKRHLLDMFAVTAAGSAQPGIGAAVELMRAQGGTAQSRLPFHGGWLPASSVAFAAGPMARAADLGDVHEGWPEAGIDRTFGHTAEYTFPALLGALGLREPVSGRDLITAFVLGTETLVRIAAASASTRQIAVFGEPIDHGGWYVFGAVAAVARLLGLSLEQTLDAMGAAKSVAQAHDMAMYAEGSLMVRMHHGFIARDAVDLCQLVARGIDGPRQVLAGSKGFWQMLSKGRWPVDPELASVDLGTRFLSARTSFKPFSACKQTHRAATAVIELLDDAAVAGEQVSSIHCLVSQKTASMCADPPAIKWDPQTEPDLQFSLPYVLSTVAFTRKFLIDELKEPTRSRADIRELMARVTIEIDGALGQQDAEVTLELRDGRRLRRAARHCKGTPELPFTDAEWAARVRDLGRYAVRPLSEGAADRLTRTCLCLEMVEDVSEELVAPLT